MIQERFDVEISPQDDHALLIHLETCDSCRLFHHQVQQVILASEDLPLPEELLPQKPEALSQRIVTELPEPPKGWFNSLLLLIDRFKGNGKPKSQANKGFNSEITFPHISRPIKSGDGQRAYKPNAEQIDDAEALGDRLKSLPKNIAAEPLTDSREAQSTTRSLGEKFGLQVPPSGLFEERPLNLAEAIRRQRLQEPPNQEAGSANSPPPEWGAQPAVNAFADNTSGNTVGGGSIAGSGMTANQGTPPMMPNSNAPIIQPQSQSSWGGANNVASNLPGMPPPGSIPGPGGAAFPPPPAPMPGAFLPQTNILPGAPAITPFGTAPQPNANAEDLTALPFSSNQPPASLVPSSTGPPGNPFSISTLAQQSNSNSVTELSPQTPPGGAMRPAQSSDQFSSSWSEPSANQLPFPNLGESPAPGVNAGFGNFAAGAGAFSTANPFANPANPANPPIPPTPSAPAPSAFPTPATRALPAESFGSPLGASTAQALPASGSASGLGLGSDSNLNPTANPHQPTGPAPTQAPPAFQAVRPQGTTPGADWGPAPQHGNWDGPENLNENWQRRPEPTLNVAPKPILKLGVEETTHTNGGAAFLRPEQPLWGETAPPSAPEPIALPANNATHPQDAWSSTAYVRQGQQDGGPQKQAVQPSSSPDWGSFSSSLSSNYFNPAESPANQAVKPPNAPTPDGSNWEQPSANLSPWGTEPENPARLAKTADQSKSKLPAWSIEAEQVETGTWPAYISDQSGAAGTNVPVSGSQPTPAADFNEWEMPIQEKLARQKSKAAESEVRPTLPLGNVGQPLTPTGVPEAPKAVPLTNDAKPTFVNFPNSSMQQEQLAQVKETKPMGWIQTQPSIQAKTNIPDADLWGIESEDITPGFIEPLNPNPQGASTRQPTQANQSHAMAELTSGWGEVSPAKAADFTTPSSSSAAWLEPVQAAGQPPISQPNITPLPVPPASMPNRSSMEPGQSSAAASLTPRISPIPAKNPQSIEPTSQQVPSPNPFGQNTPAPQAPMTVRVAGERSHGDGWGLGQSNSTNTNNSPSAADGSANRVSAASEEDGSGLFKKLDDRAIDKLFAENLGLNEPTATPMGSPRRALAAETNAAAVSAPPPTAPIAPPPQGNLPTPPSEHLFAIDDSVIDRIFADNLGITNGAATVRPPSLPKPSPRQTRVNEAIKQIADVVQSIPTPPPKIAGVGRLDAKIDSNNDSGSGRISFIGKFLLDGKDFEKIGKITSSDLSDTTMRILSTDAAAELKGLLQNIGTQPGILGSVIVGKDGLLIVNTMPKDIDAEIIGVLALAMYMNTQDHAKKLGHDQVYQIVTKTARGYLIIADFGSGLLVTLSDASQTDSLVALMRVITQLVAS